MYKTLRNISLLGVGLSVSAIVGWLLLREAKRDKELTTLTIKSQSRVSEPDETTRIVLPLNALDAEAEQSELADDLTEIKDIGPRFAQALQTIGITSFARLAQQTPEDLADQMSKHVTVRAERIRNNNWIGQAAERAKN